MTHVTCPVCWRPVGTENGIVKPHVDLAHYPCPMSRRAVPASARREAELEDTASRVLGLAAELRDDTTAVWGALDTATPQQLREWLVIALAAINIDAPASALLGWVEQIGEAA